jgi:hypothetical protein
MLKSNIAYHTRGDWRKFTPRTYGDKRENAAARRKPNSVHRRFLTEATV